MLFKPALECYQVSRFFLAVIIKPVLSLQHILLKVIDLGAGMVKITME